MNKKKLLFPHCSINQPKTTTTTKICGVFSIVPKRSLEAVYSMIKPVKWLTCNQTAVFCMLDLLKEGVPGSTKCSPLFPRGHQRTAQTHHLIQGGGPGLRLMFPTFPQGHHKTATTHHLIQGGGPRLRLMFPTFPPEVIKGRPQHTIWYKEEVLLYHFF